MDFQAITIAQLYKQRWQVELFFKWIKQHLHVEVFFGHSENAVKTQVWSAVTTYLLIAIFRKEAELEIPLSQMLHFISDILYEQTPVRVLFQNSLLETAGITSEQLSLFKKKTKS